MDKLIPLSIFRPVSVPGLIRLGNQYDGGYVVHGPSLYDAACLVNYGVGYNVAFEKDFFRLTGHPTIAFDPTLKDFSLVMKKLLHAQMVPFLRHLKNFVLWPFQERHLPHSKIRMISEGIADHNQGRYQTLTSHLEKYDLSDKKIVLKIDTEGAEYAVFADEKIYDSLVNCLQIIVEFHEIDQHMNELLAFMDKLKTSHSLVHVHGNNHDGTFLYRDKVVPKTLELTFLTNNYLSGNQPSAGPFPVPGLDNPCRKNRADITLNFFY